MELLTQFRGFSHCHTSPRRAQPTFIPRHVDGRIAREPFGRGVATSEARTSAARPSPTPSNGTTASSPPVLDRAQYIEQTPSRPLTPECIERYRARRPKDRQAPVGVPVEPPREIPEPYDIQLEALGTAAHLRNFASNAFDYININEFHHAAAHTYRRLISIADSAAGRERYP